MGSEASELTSMRRFEEKPGGNRSILGVQKGSFPGLSLDYDAEKTRLQGIGRDESLDAVAI